MMKGSLQLTHHGFKATKSMAEAAQLVDRGPKAEIVTVGWKCFSWEGM